MATTRVTGRGQKSPVDEEFLKQLYQGGEMLAQGRLGDARQMLERAHQLQPRNEKSRNLLGLAYFKLGLFERAAEIYEALVRDNPVDATLRVNLGLVYLKTNALQRAMREFEAATDLQPDHHKAHNYLGVALAQAREFGRAREHFLLAGSDVMAEKMAKAIAGEKFDPPVKPTPPAPVPPPRPPPPPPTEGQWGAQFGLDEVPPPPPPPDPDERDDEVEAEAEDADELRFAEDEGPGAPAREASDGDAIEEDVDFGELDDAETSEEVSGRTSEPPMARRAPPRGPLDDAAPELPPRPVAFPALGGVPVLNALVPALALAGATAAQSFRVGHGSLSVHVDGELLTRLEGLVAYTGQLEFLPERKRFRGRATEQSFGESTGQLVRVSGQGVLFLQSSPERTFLAVHLGDEGAYIREPCVFAFEELVSFENGKVPSEGAADLDLVHLRGQGRVVLALPGTLRSLAVVQETPVRVPLSHLVGWQGKVTPRMLSLPGEGAPALGLVELSGEGFALISLTVR